MSPLVAALLGVLQGATEFLPISSSAHLVIVPALTGMRPPSLEFDVLLHGGTLVAVLVYFRRDLISVLKGASGEARQRRLGPSSRLLLILLAATTPAALVGVLFEEFFEGLFSSPVSAGVFLLVTAGLMLAADRLGRNSHELERLGWAGGLLVGAAQALAIAPGISRSGSTISAGMFLGLKREAAARFSFLLSIPIIAGTVLLEGRRFSLGGVTPVAGLSGFLAAAAVGYACIAFLLRYLSTHRLRPFAVYCLIAGALTIGVFLLKS